jgi:hypothetical protein
MMCNIAYVIFDLFQSIAPSTCEALSEPSHAVDFIFHSNSDLPPKLQARVAIQRGDKLLAKTRFSKKAITYNNFFFHSVWYSV